MKEAAEILAGIKERLQKLEDSNIRVVNIYSVHREVSRITQKIKDKASNISDLNKRRDFPLKKEEINDLMVHIATCLHKLDHFFHGLQYGTKGDMFDDDTIRYMKAVATSNSVQLSNDKEEISTLVMSLRLILNEKNNMPLEEQRKISGLKKRIRNLQSKIMEKSEYEDLEISMSRWRKRHLADAAKPAMEMNRQIASMIDFDETKREELAAIQEEGRPA